MKSNKIAPKKNAAQAMVEFALVLPILLLLLYGVLEAGRLLFMYSSIVTASRQASRYGASTGAGTGGVDRYRDCAGIRDAADRVDYLRVVNPATDITIEYDTLNNSGNPTPVNGTDGNNTCDGASDAAVNPGTDNKTRIVVTVSGRFTPLVPLVPFPGRTITAKSARTILRSVTIVVPNAGATGTTTLINTTPMPSQPGETVTISVTVNAGTGTPTGTVAVTWSGGTICTITLSGGTGSCTAAFTSTTDLTATYTPDTSSFTGSAGNRTHQVGAATTVIEPNDFDHDPNPSIPGQPVLIAVTVKTVYSGAPVPTGVVNITTPEGTCQIPLAGGYGTCSVIFNNLGTPSIIAEYVPADPQIHLGTARTEVHEVLAVPATASNTPPPSATFTPPPPATPTFTPTIAPTPVTGCTNIQVPTGQTITLSTNTMYLNIYNPMTYDVTIKDVFVRWNYLKGHNPGDSNLHLLRAQLNSALGTTIFWTGDEHAPSYSPPLSTTVIIPANSTSRILFTFNQTYTKPESEQIQINFLTPGCEGHTINVVKK